MIINSISHGGINISAFRMAWGTFNRTEGVFIAGLMANSICGILAFILFFSYIKRLNSRKKTESLHFKSQPLV